MHYGMEIAAPAAQFLGQSVRVLMTAGPTYCLQELRLRLARTDAPGKVSSYASASETRRSGDATVRRGGAAFAQAFPYRDSFHRLP